MKKYTTISMTLLVSVFLFAGYLVCGENNCLFQPSITETGFEHYAFKVRHYNTNGIGCNPQCNHGCDTSTGTIQVIINNNRDEYVAGPFDLHLEDTQACCTFWESGTIEIPLATGDKAVFIHDVYAMCTTTVIWD